MMVAPSIRQPERYHSPTFVLAAIVVLGMAAVALLSNWIEHNRPATDSAFAEEELYLSGSAARQLSLGFRGLAADWYWMRSLQYVGNKILSMPQGVELDDLSQLNLRLLAPLLDTATTLDPEFLEPYEYAAVVLPAVDLREAIRITEKGLAANPTAWRLYHQLGYIHWQRGDFKASSEAYGRGAQVPGAPSWMEVMRARMAAEGGSRSTAREIYLRLFQESGDPNVKDMARRRLLQIASFEQRDLIQKVISLFRQQTRRCPSSWKEIASQLKASGLDLDLAGAPLDPAGTAYILQTTDCSVDLDPGSEVPHR